MDSPLPFILQLRCICETIFDTMLSAYISVLQAHRDQSTLAGRRGSVKRLSFDGLDQALKSSMDALEAFRKAEAQRKDGDVVCADKSVQEGLHLLYERYVLANLHLPSVMITLSQYWSRADCVQV
jgi:hypothetical protein